MTAKKRSRGVVLSPREKEIVADATEKHEVLDPYGVRILTGFADGGVEFMLHDAAGTMVQMSGSAWRWVKPLLKELTALRRAD